LVKICTTRRWRATVQRGGRGTLDDLDALDVVRVDVGEPVRRVAAQVDELPRRVVDDHAVDDVERLGAAADGGEAADADAGAAARRAGVLLHQRAGHLAGQRHVQLRRDGVGELLALHRGERRAQLRALGLDARAGGHDLRQLQHVAREREVLRRAARGLGIVARPGR
jgi:hypothetical protein